MTAADEVAEASLAHAEEARLLQIKKASPVFLLKRISYGESSRPVEFVRSIYRGDRWKLVSRLTVNPNTGSNTAARKPVAVPRTMPSSARHRQQQVELGSGRRPRSLAHQQEEL